jgi:hypothetical protein
MTYLNKTRHFNLAYVNIKQFVWTNLFPYVANFSCEFPPHRGENVFIFSQQVSNTCRAKEKLLEWFLTTFCFVLIQAPFFKATTYFLLRAYTFCTFEVLTVMPSGIILPKPQYKLNTKLSHSQNHPSVHSTFTGHFTFFFIDAVCGVSA